MARVKRDAAEAAAKAEDAKAKAEEWWQAQEDAEAPMLTRKQAIEGYLAAPADAPLTGWWALPFEAQELLARQGRGPKPPTGFEIEGARARRAKAQMAAAAEEAKQEIVEEEDFNPGRLTVGQMEKKFKDAAGEALDALKVKEKAESDYRITREKSGFHEAKRQMTTSRYDLAHADVEALRKRVEAARAALRTAKHIDDAVRHAGDQAAATTRLLLQEEQAKYRDAKAKLADALEAKKAADKTAVDRASEDAKAEAKRDAAATAHKNKVKLADAAKSLWVHAKNALVKASALSHFEKNKRQKTSPPSPPPATSADGEVLSAKAAGKQPVRVTGSSAVSSKGDAGAFGEDYYRKRARAGAQERGEGTSHDAMMAMEIDPEDGL